MTAFIRNAFSLKQGVPDDKNRVVLLDFIRGFAMILVMLGHSNPPGKGYIMLFHMPMFFLLSGYTRFLRSDKAEMPFGTYVKKQFCSLMIPDYCFEIINAFLWCGQQVARGAALPTSKEWMSILLLADIGKFGGMGNRFWFLPCMFISSLLFYWLLRLFKTKPGRLCAMITLFFLAWVTARLIPLRLPLQLDTMPMATAYLMLGYLGGSLIRKSLENKTPIADFVLFLFMVILVWFSHLNGAFLRMYENQFGPYPYVLLAAVAGSFAAMLLCKYLFVWFQRIPVLYNYIRWCGANSLGVYTVHMEVRTVESLGLTILSSQYWYFHFAFVVVVTIPIVNTISVYFPFLFGKTRKKIGASS